jgi:glycosyltransferase involved in cell wall biosynthesis
MRILTVTSLYLSGHGNFVAEQVRALRASQVDVDVLFFDPRETRTHYLRALAPITRAIASGRYDLVHTHHTYTMIQVAVSRRLARSRIPVVFTHHESESLDNGRRTRTLHPTSLLRHSMLVKRNAARRADFVIFVSRKVLEALALDWPPQEVIPCGVDLQKFRPLDRGTCRSKLGVDPMRPVIFFPANPRNLRKRFELARQAYELVLQRAPNALLMVGGGIEADAMPLYYNAADVMLQTSYSEASPTVVKEALACETPIVSTDVGDTREVLTGAPHCSVCPDSPGELAKQVLLALGHRVNGGPEHLLRHGLSLEQTAAKVQDVYERVLGPGRGAPREMTVGRSG